MILGCVAHKMCCRGKKTSPEEQGGEDADPASETPPKDVEVGDSLGKRKKKQKDLELTEVDAPEPKRQGSKGAAGTSSTDSAESPANRRASYPSKLSTGDGKWAYQIERVKRLQAAVGDLPGVKPLAMVDSDGHITHAADPKSQIKKKKWTPEHGFDVPGE